MGKGTTGPRPSRGHPCPHENAHGRARVPTYNAGVKTKHTRESSKRMCAVAAHRRCIRYRNASSGNTMSSVPTCLAHAPTAVRSRSSVCRPPTITGAPCTALRLDCVWVVSGGVREFSLIVRLPLKVVGRPWSSGSTCPRALRSASGQVCAKSQISRAHPACINMMRAKACRMPWILLVWAA